MSTSFRFSLPLILSIAMVQTARGQVQTYTDEAAFLTALTSLSLPAVHESFEDNAAWGSVRTTIVGGTAVASSITSQGVTWSPNGVTSGITTGHGPAITGNWGMFQLPHGNPATGVRDGWVGVGSQPLAAIGGWISCNQGSIELRLDGVAVGFSGNNNLTNTPKFFGAIDPAGFSQFEWEELEATPGDWKLIFSDDFTFAVGGSVIDCNQNGLGDALDISNGTSGDCNLNGIPDECEIPASSTAPGGPFYCQTACDTDCNDNGLLDECEATTPVVFSSAQLSPIGFGVNQTFTIPSPPVSMGTVVLTFTAVANFGGNDEYVTVDLNGVVLGLAFEMGALDCPSNQPDTAQITVPASVFNSAVQGGSATFHMVASQEVDPNDCQNPSFIAMDVSIPVPSALDTNGNGILDTCESIGLVYCSPAQPNTVSASGATIRAFGSNIVVDNNLTFEAEDLPLNQFTLLVNGADAGNVAFPGGSLGILCLGGAIGRHKTELAFSGPTGSAQFAPDLTAIPTPFGNTAVLPGETFHFQAWYRDFTGGVSVNNFTDAVEITFQ